MPRSLSVICPDNSAVRLHVPVPLAWTDIGDRVQQANTVLLLEVCGR